MLFRTQILIFVLVFTTCLNSQTVKHYVEGGELNINNIIAKINANGRLFTEENQPADATKPGFELKDAEGKHSIHTGTLWLGAMHENTF